MSGHPSIAAVIVTHNRAAKLARVLAALDAQTRRPDAIYVIDNASTDDTAAVIAARQDARVQHIRLAENIGGAGGFHAGIKRAYADGHTYFWVSDDDAYPEPDAIARLAGHLEALEAETGWRAPFACSRVNWTDGSLCEMNTPPTVWDWPRWYRPDTPVFLVQSCSFVSVLVTRWAVEAHGLPLKEYFIWHDDVEFTRRLARSYPGLYCLDSVVIHDTPENKGVNFAFVTAANLWKYEYGARNETSRVLRDNGLWGVVAYAWDIGAQMRSGRVARGPRRKVWRAIWRGLWFRPTIDRVD